VYKNQNNIKETPVYLVDIYMENITKTNIKGIKIDRVHNIQYTWKIHCGDCTFYIQHKLYIMRHNTDGSLLQTSMTH
jgi:hypothetical protein